MNPELKKTGTSGISQLLPVAAVAIGTCPRCASVNPIPLDTPPTQIPPPRTRITTPTGTWRKKPSNGTPGTCPNRHGDSDPELDEKKKEAGGARFKEPEKNYVPFFVTVMGKNGKILLNVVPDLKRRREIQVFYNKGRQDDGIQITRSCLRNMLSIEVDKIVCINAFKGYYLAIQSNHTDHNTRWYRTDPKYKSNIGTLEYVALKDIGDFADSCRATMGPKIVNYIDELQNYFNICREIATEIGV